MSSSLEEAYVAPVYQPPASFALVGRVFDDISGTGNTSLLAFVNGTQEEQVDYIESMIGIGVFFLCFIIIWFLTLLVVKCQGRESMGCAAGYAFHDSLSDQESVIEERRQKKTRKNNNELFNSDGFDVSIGAAAYKDDSVFDEGRRRNNSNYDHQDKKTGQSTSNNGWMLGSFSSSKGTKSSSTNHPSARKAPKMPDFDYDSDGEHNHKIEAYVEPEPPFMPNHLKTSSHHSKSSNNQYYQHSNNVLYSLPKSNNNETDQSSCCSPSWCCCCAHDPDHVQARKFRTRFVYTIFCIVSLTCSALLMTKMYTPLEASAQTTAVVVQDTQVVVAEVDEVLRILRETADLVQTIYDTTPLDYQQLCPGVSTDVFISLFQFDPQSVIDTITDEYTAHFDNAVSLLNEAQSMSDTVTLVLIDVDSALQNTEEYLWIIPLMIFFSMFVTFAMGGLMGAVIYKERKHNDVSASAEETPAIEKWFGWTFLPFQIFIVSLSWGLVIAFCFGTVMTSDSCVPRTTTTSFVLTDGTVVAGTPEQTVLAVLSTYTQDSIDEATFQQLAQYITGCQGEDPLQEIDNLQSVLNTSLAFVDERMQLVDIIGIPVMESQCGEGNNVATFFDNIRLLQQQMVRVNNDALEMAKTALACPRINDLYIRAVHEAVCTEFATANANGFLLFLVVSFSGMILISLRASWRTSLS